MNILFLGGAKRVSMARLFKRAASARGQECSIYSYEISTHVPVSIEAQVILGRRWSDSQIYADIADIARRHRIGLIVPFVDGAVAVAAETARRYPDLVFAPACSPEMAERMFDKVEAASLFESLSLPVPPTYSGAHAEAAGPLIAKPRHGSASKGLVCIDTPEQLARVMEHPADYLVQSRIDHREEYTVDCYVSIHSGRIIALVPRLRIEVSGGEVTHTATVIRPEVTDLTREALAATGLRGAVTVQVIRDLDTDRYMIMEINPRLGGGAVCSVLAGVDLPGIILDDAAGLTQDYVCYRPYTEMVRYPQEVAFFN